MISNLIGGLFCFSYFIFFFIKEVPMILTTISGYKIWIRPDIITSVVDLGSKREIYADDQENFYTAVNESLEDIIKLLGEDK